MFFVKLRGLSRAVQAKIEPASIFRWMPARKFLMPYWSIPPSVEIRAKAVFRQMADIPSTKIFPRSVNVRQAAGK
jgi:hypothetical protein